MLKNWQSIVHQLCKNWRKNQKNKHCRKKLTRLLVDFRVRWYQHKERWELSTVPTVALCWQHIWYEAKVQQDASSYSWLYWKGQRATSCWCLPGRLLRKLGTPKLSIFSSVANACVVYIHNTTIHGASDLNLSGLRTCYSAQGSAFSNQNDVSAHWRGQIAKKWKFGLCNIGLLSLNDKKIQIVLCDVVLEWRHGASGCDYPRLYISCDHNGRCITRRVCTYMSVRPSVCPAVLPSVSVCLCHSEAIAMNDVSHVTPCWSVSRDHSSLIAAPL